MVNDNVDKIPSLMLDFGELVILNNQLADHIIEHRPTWRVSKRPTEWNTHIDIPTVVDANNVPQVWITVSVACLPGYPNEPYETMVIDLDSQQDPPTGSNPFRNERGIVGLIHRHTNLDNVVAFLDGLVVI